MIARIAKHVRGNVVAYVAVFLALGGTAVAAGKIGTRQLKNNAVTTKKIANNAVKASKIANGAVTNAKLADNAVDSAKIANGSVSQADLAAGVGTAKAFGKVTYQSNAPTATGTGIVSVSETGAGDDGFVCVNTSSPITVASANGENQGGAATELIIAEVPNPPTGGTQCPAGTDILFHVERNSGLAQGTFGNFYFVAF